MGDLDKIEHLETGSDTILLSNSVFTGVKAGALGADAFLLARWRPQSARGLNRQAADRHEPVFRRSRARQAGKQPVIVVFAAAKALRGDKILVAHQFEFSPDTSS